MKFFFLLLFFLGICLLIFIEENIKILYVVVVLLLPYIFIVIYEHFRDEMKQKQENHYDEIFLQKLLKTGVPVIINFEIAVNNIEEKIITRNEDFDYLRQFFLLNILSDNQIDEVFTLVELKYKIGKKVFLKKIFFPFSKQSTESILKMQKKTTLYYNPKSPQESIVDLQFITNYI